MSRPSGTSFSTEKRPRRKQFRALSILAPTKRSVCPSLIAGMPKHPRLRRVSAISKFAVVAGLEALRDAQVEVTEIAERVALIFAISNGGVIYTKRFFHELVETGAQAASPLLFPETVFNAPASHLAAILGITGASYTLVGDGAVGILALKMAEDLMESEALDYCLVVGAEEVDWLLCDAYNKWRLLRRHPPIEPFSRPPRGMILSEGAGAVLLGRKGKVAIDRISAGRRLPEAKRCFRLAKKNFSRTGTRQIFSPDSERERNFRRSRRARRCIR